MKHIPVTSDKVSKGKAVITEAIDAQAESRLMADCDLETVCMIDTILIYSI